MLQKIFSAARTAVALTAIFSVLVGLCTASGCFASLVVVYYTPEGGLHGYPCSEVNDAASALNVLALPPLPAEAGRELISAVPLGTRLLSLTTDGDIMAADFSAEMVASGMDEAQSEAIYWQVKGTLEQSGWDGGVRILVNGRPLYEYLPQTNPVPKPPPAKFTPSSIHLAGNLVGKKISLSPGHGKKWSGSAWTYDRPVYCAPLNEEDLHNLELCQYLETYLNAEGATLKINRCTDKSFGNYVTGDPWWRMGPSVWLKQKGYPCSIYANATGDCNLGVGASESSDNIRARGLAADYDNVDIHVAIHTNGYTGDCAGMSCPNGTCTYYDNSSGHAAWGAISQSLATFINNNVINTIHNDYPDAAWRNRGVLDFAGGNYETRVPARAAVLIELAFHDSCDWDGLYLQDNFFRSMCMYGMYKGICEYFGTAPTWAFYSYEVVSHDIPSTMNTGENRTVHIVLRNRGVLWNDARQFRLGAVGDSDPFTASTRVNVGGEVGPNNTVTFTINLTAPAVPGTYSTDWRMLREAVTWFGPTVQKNIQVVMPGSDTQAPTVPTNLTAVSAGAAQINLSWDASVDNVGVAGYNIYRDGVVIDTSPTTSYQNTGLTSYTSYSYQVSAFDAVGNESAKSNTANATTDFDTEYIIDEDAAVWVSSWILSTSNGYSGDYIWGSSTVTDMRSVKWTPNLQVSGMYDVYAWWVQGSNRSTVAPFTIAYSGGSTTVQVDQTQNGSKWNLLASNRPFQAGTAGYVILNSGTGVAGAVLVADAVRFVYKGVLDIEAPSAPTGLAATAVSPSQIDLTWNASIDNVAVTGYRIYNGAEQVGTSAVTSYSHSNLVANTAYTYTVKAFDAMGNLSAVSNAVTRYSLSLPPTTSTVSCDRQTGTWYTTSGFNYTAVGGFGSGRVQYYGYAWNKSPAYTWTGTEPTWASGVLGCTATSIGSWYLHLKGYNADNAANGTLDIGPYKYTSDAIPPTVNSVFVSPALAQGGDNLQVTADVYDASGVASVRTSSFVYLTKTVGNLWTGAISALAGLGAHSVTLIATDIYDNSGTDISGSYLTAPVLWIANKSLLTDALMPNVSGKYLFRTWGRVTFVDANLFDLWDGFGTPVRVYAQGHGLSTGWTVSAQGIWDYAASPPTLRCLPNRIQRLDQ